METARARSATVGRPQVVGLFVLAVLTSVWCWWAVGSGAWFGVVLLPGAILLCATLIVLCAAAPRLPRLRGRYAVALILIALIALGAWAAVSALWSPAPDAAIADGQRIVVYAVAFGLGLWMALLLRERPELALVSLAVAGAFAGVVTVIGMIATDSPATYIGADRTLYFPIGYHNANAAFFLIASLPALGLASSAQLDWRLRGLAQGAATLCFGLALLSQSRGSVPAALIAVLVYVVLSPLRLRAICWLALAFIPALGVIPALSELFRAAGAGVSGAGDELEAAGIAVAWTSGASVLLGAVAARLDRKLPGLGSSSPRANTAIIAALLVVGLGGVAGFAIAVGDPVDWAEKRADEFRAGTPDFEDESTRFTFDLGTDRYDLWRVAVEDARADPLRGTGGGGFQYTYLRERESRYQTARDAHSIQLEVLGELGVPGLLLLLVAVSAAVVTALRSRRLGGEGAALVAVSLAVFAYWLAHASIDWFWPYPAITAPVIALLGSASAGGMMTMTEAGTATSASARLSRDDGQSPRPSWIRAFVAVGAVSLAISAIPPFLSQRYLNSAYAGWKTNLTRAYDDLDSARSLNPLAVDPWLAEGAIAAAAEDRARAMAAFRKAVAKRPEEWTSHYFLAELLADDRPRLARRELDRARRLNPNSPEIEELDGRLRASGPGRTP